jgi:hypothetical protein
MTAKGDQINLEASREPQGMARRSVRTAPGNPPAERHAPSDAPYQPTQFRPGMPGVRSWFSPQVGGYEVRAEPSLAIQRLGQVRREEARLQEK